MTMLLGACAIVLPPKEGQTADDVWASRQHRLAAIERWVLQGRVGVETGTDSGSAALNWEQNGDDYAMRIMAPLSQGTYELKGNAAGVTLRSPDNSIVSAKDPQALMQRSLGWSLPVRGLKYWVRGIPAPDRPVDHIRVDDSGRLLDLQQDGWRVSVQRYRQVGAEELPDKIFMESDPLKMRVVIGEWQLP